MRLCRTQGAVGRGRSAHEPWRGLGHRGTRVIPAYRHPPVEPALCHRDSPTVASEGWGARSRALAAAAGPGHPPDCVLARGTPPRFHPHTTVRSRAPGRQWGLRSPRRPRSSVFSFSPSLAGILNLHTTAGRGWWQVRTYGHSNLRWWPWTTHRQATSTSPRLHHTFNAQA